ncbi:MAG TPA: hypothetical protein GXZ70_08930 [Clostridiales bacterium]|nr:hypothetical protein [Clostridiales bacterium]
MSVHEKGRVTMNANNKLLFFLGAFLSFGLMFLCVLRKAFDCLSDSCAKK